MLDADKHLLAAEYLIGTFYPTEDSPPAAMSHDQEPLSLLPTLFWRLPSAL